MAAAGRYQGRAKINCMSLPDKERSVQHQGRRVRQGTVASENRPHEEACAQVDDVVEVQVVTCECVLSGRSQQ